MSWNYRVCKHKGIAPHFEPYYAIHEVYYKEKDSDASIYAVTTLPVGILGDSVEELQGVYKLFGKAFDSPVLDYDALCEEIDNQRLQDWFFPEEEKEDVS
jgi:hypothetical protein